MEKLYPFLFEPNLHTVVWGGDRLCPYKGLEPKAEPIGESWEVSAVPSSVSVIRNGSFAGKDLVSVVSEYPSEILGETVAKNYDNKLPLLIKFIDAKRVFRFIRTTRWRAEYMASQVKRKCGILLMPNLEVIYMPDLKRRYQNTNIKNV